MKRIGLFIALLLILMMTLMPLYILKERLTIGETPASIDRLHWNTNNTTRVWADNWEQVQDKAADILQGDQNTPLEFVILTGTSSWQNPLLASCLLAKPSHAIMYMLNAGNQDRILEKIRSTRPAGMKVINGTQIILIGETVSLSSQLRENGFKVMEIDGDTPVIAQKIVHLRQQIASNLSEFVLVDADSDFRYALPAGNWAVHQGTPIIPVSNNTLSPELKQVLAEFSIPTLYLIKSEDNLNLTTLAGQMNLKNIDISDSKDAAAEFASYYDAGTKFGWRATQATTEGGKMFLAAPDDDWRFAMAGMQLFSREVFGPLLFVSSNEVPPMVEKFYFNIKPDWWVTPAEGPYNHTWILGSNKIISYAVQGRINFLQEISNYETQGDQGLSGIESLALVWYFLAIAGALWVYAHLSTHLFMLSPFMKLAWILFILATGPLGLLAYYICYRGYAHPVAYGEFRRPVWVQSLSATCSTAGFGIPTMISIAFVLTLFGLPLFLGRGFWFFLGTPMSQSVIWSYLGTIIINALVFVPLMLSMKENSDYWDTVRANWLTVVISMTSISIGMMTTMWLIMMGFQMRPEESNLNWWAAMYSANIVGVATGYLANWLLVVYGEKKGTM